MVPNYRVQIDLIP